MDMNRARPDTGRETTGTGVTDRPSFSFPPPTRAPTQQHDPTGPRSFMVRNRMVAAALALLVCTAAVGAVYEAQWRKVREAEGKDLPRTALEALAPIERDALNARDYPQALRALAERIALEAEIQGDKP